PLPRNDATPIQLPDYPLTTSPHSLSPPLRRSLLTERGDAFAEVGAGVAQLDQIAVLARRQALLRDEAARELLDRTNRQWRVRGDLRAELADCAVDVVRTGDAVHETERVGFGRVHEPAGEHQLLEARGAQESDQSIARIPRQAVAERPGDRYAEGRLGRGHPQIAAQRDGTPPAGGHPLDLCDRRLRHALQAIQYF